MLASAGVYQLEIIASDHALTPLFSVGADPPHAGPLAVAW